jgi:diguanylate cyclase (GGDEF)-like protein
VVIEQDITVRKEYEDKLIQQANYDSLTNLPNRRLLMDRLNQEMARAQRQRRYLVLKLIDLDNFKKVNQFMGHASGDDVLKEVALRLQKCVRNSDTIARFSGDKFFCSASGSGPSGRGGINSGKDSLTDQGTLHRRG